MHARAHLEHFRGKRANNLHFVVKGHQTHGVIRAALVQERQRVLAERGYDHTYGARPLRRIIQNLIEDPLAEGLLESRFASNTTIRVEVEDDLLKLSPVEELAIVG